jgi:hypothetical protein
MRPVLSGIASATDKGIDQSVQTSSAIFGHEVALRFRKAKGASRSISFPLRRLRTFLICEPVKTGNIE